MQLEVALLAALFRASGQTPCEVQVPASLANELSYAFPMRTTALNLKRVSCLNGEVNDAL